MSHFFPKKFFFKKKWSKTPYLAELTLTHFLIFWNFFHFLFFFIKFFTQKHLKIPKRPLLEVDNDTHFWPFVTQKLGNFIRQWTHFCVRMCLKGCPFHHDKTHFFKRCPFHHDSGEKRVVESGRKNPFRGVRGVKNRLNDEKTGF